MEQFSFCSREGSCPQSHAQNGHSGPNSQQNSPRGQPSDGVSPSTNGGSPSSHGGTSLHVQDFVPHIARIAKLIENKVITFWKLFLPTRNLYFFFRLNSVKIRSRSFEENLNNFLFG